MPIIQAPLGIAAGPTSPRANPAAFGGMGEALVSIGRLAETEINRRNEQRQAAQLATLRATSANRVDEFLQRIERDTDFATFGSRWDEQRTSLAAELQGSVDPVVWQAFSPEWARMEGNATRTVRDYAYAREDDHNIAVLDQSNASILARAGSPSADSELDLHMLSANVLERYRSGAITESAAQARILREREAYLYATEYSAVTRDPLGWLGLRGAAPSAGPVEVVPGATDHLTGSGLNGVDNSGASVADAGPEVQAQFDATRDALNAAGRAFGAPIRVSNIYRSPEHNAAVSGAENSQHMHGTAADIVGFADMPEDRQVALVQAMVDAGFTSFGFYSDGSLHVDRRENAALWSNDPDGNQVPLNTYAPDAVVAAILERRMAPQAIPVAGGGGAETAPSPPTRPYIEGLTPEQNEALYNRAERLAHAQLERDRIAIQGQVEDYTTAITLGLEGERPSSAAVMAAYATDPAGGAEIVAGLDRLEALGATFEAMRDMTPADLRAFMDSEREALRTGGQEGITDRAQRLAALEGANTEILTAREDPAAYVLQRDPVLQEQFENAQTPEDWSAAIQASLAAQDRFVDRPDQRRPLPGQYVTALVDGYNQSQSPEERVSMLAGITAGLGSDGALVFDQLEAAGLDPAVRYVVEQSGRVGLPAAGTMAAILANEQLQEDYEAAYPAGAERRNADAALLAPYRDRLTMYDGRESIVGDLGQSSTIRAAEEAAFLRLARGAAMQQRGTPDLSAAGQNVYGLMFGGEALIDERLGYATVPADRASAVAEGMEAAREALLMLDAPAEYAPYLGFAPTDADALIARSAWEGMVQGARWVNYGSGYALAMPVHGPMGAYLPAADGSGVRVWSVDELVSQSPTVIEEESEARLDDVMDAVVDQLGADTVVQP